MILNLPGVAVDLDWHDVLVAGGVIFAAALLTLLFVRVARHRRSALLDMAINNISQGLLMYDAAERVVVCNERYLKMYGLSPDIVKPGALLIDVIRHRFETGSIALDPEEYRQQILTAVMLGKAVNFVGQTLDGRSISVINRPIPGTGYWVGTHDDITERLLAEKQRDSRACAAAALARPRIQYRPHRRAEQGVELDREIAQECGRGVAVAIGHQHEDEQRNGDGPDQHLDHAPLALGDLLRSGRGDVRAHGAYFRSSCPAPGSGLRPARV